MITTVDISLLTKVTDDYWSFLVFGTLFKQSTNQ